MYQLTEDGRGEGGWRWGRWKYGINNSKEPKWVVSFKGCVQWKTSTAEQCQTHPWPPVPGWSWCRNADAGLFFLASGIRVMHSGRALGIPFATTQYGRAASVQGVSLSTASSMDVQSGHLFHRKQYECGLVQGLKLLVWLTCSQLHPLQDIGQPSQLP